MTVYTLHNGVHHVEESEPEIFASVDLCMDKVRTIMRKTKEKGLEKGKWPGHGGSAQHGGTVERLGLGEDGDSSPAMGYKRS